MRTIIAALIKASMSLHSTVHRYECRGHFELRLHRDLGNIYLHTHCSPLRIKQQAINRHNRQIIQLVS